MEIKYEEQEKIKFKFDVDKIPNVILADFLGNPDYKLVKTKKGDVVWTRISHLKK